MYKQNLSGRIDQYPVSCGPQLRAKAVPPAK
jgi:hypothetical protein